MTIADDVRGAAMGRRVLRTAAALGLADAELDLLGFCYGRARAWREARLDDDHDPHYLHPGRTALILMLDTAETHPSTLAAAILAESHRADLELPAETLLAGADEAFLPVLRDALSLRSEIPDAEAADRVERLVTAPAEALLVAVAERLDHARHSHMWLEGREDRAFLTEVDSVWIGLAERVHTRLAARFSRWARGARART